MASFVMPAHSASERDTFLGATVPREVAGLGKKLGKMTTDTVKMLIKGMMAKERALR
jgi:hypothetical protein